LVKYVAPSALPAATSPASTRPLRKTAGSWPAAPLAPCRPCPPLPRTQLDQKLEAAHTWHEDVEHGEARQATVGHDGQRLAGRSCSHDQVAQLAQAEGQQVDEVRVVVDHEELGHRVTSQHRSASRFGALSVSSVDTRLA